MQAAYYLTGKGSAVVEELRSGEVSLMMSVYHRDGADLRASHYCAAGNQPRLRAAETTERRVRFELLDVTNLATPADGHVERVVLYSPSEDQLEIEFTFTRDGQASVELVRLTRRSVGAAGRGSLNSPP